MPGPQSILLGAGIPAVVAGIVLLVAWRLSQGTVEDSSALASWGSGTALGLAVLTGHVALFGAPGFPAATAEDWIPWLTVLAVAAATWSAMARRDPAGALWVSRASVYAVALGLLLRPMTRWTWSWADAAAWFALLAAALFAWSGLLDAALERMPRRSGWAALAFASVGASIGLGLGGSIVLAQRSGALAAGAGAAAVLAWSRIGRRPGEGAATLISVALGGFLIAGHFYAELPVTAAVAFALAPVAAALPPSRDTRSDLVDLAARCAIASILVAGGIALTIASSPPLEPYTG